MNENLKSIAKKCEVNEEEAVIKILPKIMNSVVKQMQNKKTTAGAFFEAFCNFWRSTYFLLQKDPVLKRQTVKLIKDFMNSEEGRHKNRVRDIDNLFVLYFVLYDDLGSPAKFINGFVDESAIRRVEKW